MYGTVKDDLIIAISSNEGVQIPHYEVEYLRYNPKTQKIIDIRKIPQPYTFYIDEKGIKHIVKLNDNWQELKCNWNDELVLDNGKWRVKTKEEKRIEIIQQYQNSLKNLEFQRLQQILTKYGYKDLGDVQYWHSQDPKDEEPAGLLMWYKAYDDAIWNEIDNLQNKIYEQLKEYDPVAVENQIFEQTKGKLPPVED